MAARTVPVPVAPVRAPAVVSLTPAHSPAVVSSVAIPSARRPEPAPVMVQTAVAAPVQPAATQRAVPDEDDGPPWVEDPEEPSTEEGVQTSRRVVAIPVREAGLSPRLDQLRAPGEAVRLPELVTSAEGDVWFDAVMQLVRAETITALVRELGLQSQLVARDADQWLLRVERESLNQGNTRERLSTALKTLGHEVRLAVEIGPVNDSTALRLAAEAARRQGEAEQIIRDDPFVQAMMRDFGGKIVPGTLKATDTRAPAQSQPPEGVEPQGGGPVAR